MTLVRLTTPTVVVGAEFNDDGSMKYCAPWLAYRKVQTLDELRELADKQGWVVEVVDALPRYFAGIGSRETPPEIEHVIADVMFVCNAQGYTLRSGGAPGADMMFERYAKRVEIFLPYKGFNNHPSRLCEPSWRAYELAERFHPAWNRCSDRACQMHARNTHQVLGKDCKTPVDFIVCWTRGGEAVGGTGQALRIASAYNILVSNLYFEREREFWKAQRLRFGPRESKCPMCGKLGTEGLVCRGGCQF